MIYLRPNAPHPSSQFHQPHALLLFEHDAQIAQQPRSGLERDISEFAHSAKTLRPRNKMARPRIFVSSTYYDLKHIRSSLDAFIRSLGFDSILSEKGDIAYSPDAPLDESCYREATTADVFVLIVGGRYGSEASTEHREDRNDFFERYDSITKKEFDAALSNDIPTYILVDAAVYAEYRTFQKNRGNKEITYAHVDSINIFQLLEEILGLRRNNPVQSFENSSDIESWLRDQWSGLFKEFLTKRSEQQQIASLASKVEELGEMNRTLRRYIEAIITKLSPEDSKELISEEQERLELKRTERALEKNDLISYLHTVHGYEMDEITKMVGDAKSLRGFLARLEKVAESRDSAFPRGLTRPGSSEHILIDLNRARAILGLKPVRN